QAAVTQRVVAAEPPDQGRLQRRVYLRTGLGIPQVLQRTQAGKPDPRRPVTPRGHERILTVLPHLPPEELRVAPGGPVPLLGREEAPFVGDGRPRRRPKTLLTGPLREFPQRPGHAGGAVREPGQGPFLGDPGGPTDAVLLGLRTGQEALAASDCRRQRALGRGAVIQADQA